MLYSRTGLALALAALMAAPALGHVFSDPYAGTADTVVSAMSFSGSTGLGNMSVSLTGAAPGTINVATGRIVDDGDFTVSYNLGTQLGTVPLNNRHFMLTAESDPPGAPSFMPSYALGDDDPLPPRHANFFTTGQVFNTGKGLVIDAEQIVLDATSFTQTPLADGVQFTFPALMNLIGTYNGTGVILGLTGSVSFDTTPEPAGVLLLLAGLPLLRRRRPC